MSVLNILFACALYLKILSFHVVWMQSMSEDGVVQESLFYVSSDKLYGEANWSCKKAVISLLHGRHRADLYINLNQRENSSIEVEERRKKKASKQARKDRMRCFTSCGLVRNCCFIMLLLDLLNVTSFLDNDGGVKVLESIFRVRYPSVCYNYIAPVEYSVIPTYRVYPL